MMCKMVKKGILGAALGAGALALLFGTAAPSYVKTAFHSVRQSAKSNIPVEFQIQRARQQLADLNPSILKCIETVAREEYQVEKLQADVLASRQELDKQGQQLVALRKHRDNGDERLTGGVSYTRDQIDRDLARRLDRYRDGKKILAAKEDTLQKRKQGVLAAREQLDNMKAAREVLTSKIEAVEAKLRQVQATEAAAAVSFDDSALARVKETVAELEERVEVMDRVATYQAKLTDRAVSVTTEPTRDVAGEIDAEFGLPAPETRTAKDKDL